MGLLGGVLFGLLVVLFWIALSSARACIEVGRKRGVKQAVAEIQRGIASHVELDSAKLPGDVEQALHKLDLLLNRYPKARRFGTDPIDAQLWILGAALGEASWLKGHSAGVRRKAPAEGKLRVDLSLVELLQLGGLANLGFQYMMPNAKLFDIRRFDGEGDASEATRAISKLECAIPQQHRPDVVDQAKFRERMIREWWRTNTRCRAFA